MRILIALLTLLPAAALAEGFQPQAPVSQTSEAEFWYAVASVAMILMLAAAGWLVRQR
jgi:hypothetical protein